MQQLASLALGFFVLPLYLAIPEYDAIRTTYFINAYIDMVSAFTTTGFVVFDPDRLSDTLHLWRALVAWLGGALIWLAAVAILAPLNLGGFEVQVATAFANTFFDNNRATHVYSEIFLAFSALSWIDVCFVDCTGFIGHTRLRKFDLAMSVLSTSGISAAKTMSDLTIGSLNLSLSYFYFWRFRADLLRGNVLRLG